MAVETTENTPAGATPADGASVTPPQTDAPAADTVESLPDWAQRHIRELRAENEKRRKGEAESKRKAEEEKLAAEAKWQHLAEERGTKLSDLKQVAERYERLSTQLRQQVETEVGTWPDEVKSLRPTSGDAETLLEWAEKARPIVAKLSSTPPAPGQGAAPRPTGQNKPSQGDLIQRKRNSGDYVPI